MAAAEPFNTMFHPSLPYRHTLNASHFSLSRHSPYASVLDHGFLQASLRQPLSSLPAPLRHADRLEMLRISRCRGIRRMHPSSITASCQQACVSRYQVRLRMAHCLRAKTAEPDKGYILPRQIRRLSIIVIFSSKRFAIARRKKGAVISCAVLCCESVGLFRIAVKYLSGYFLWLCFVDHSWWRFFTASASCPLLYIGTPAGFEIPPK